MPRPPSSERLRSLLFVPATRPDRFERAEASGADTVCLDLEDAVPLDRKDDARRNAVARLSAARPVSVRINSPRTPQGALDIAALLGAATLPALLLVPKVEDPAEMAMLDGVYGGRLALCPLVETARALRTAWDIAAAPGVEAVLFGGVDLSADLGVQPGWEPLLHARSTLVAACSAAGRRLLDSPATDVADLPGLSETTIRARALGFTGRACIHPDQVPLVNAAYDPSVAEIAWAHRVLEALGAAKGAPALLEGKLIEEPVARAARRLLASAPLPPPVGDDIVTNPIDPGAR